VIGFQTIRLMKTQSKTPDFPDACSQVRREILVIATILIVKYAAEGIRPKWR
jgi:hypothetical protein